MKNDDLMNYAAIVCADIVLKHESILYAERSAPEDTADSGWQFLCGADDEDWNLAKVWALHEVMELDESLKPFMKMPYGTILTRLSANDAWHVSRREQ
ncbi:MAG: DUF2185 domain-containing protein [Verrucomicrobiota bacterium]|nr:DUF2185 domain-containing protein [Verrucomicrobiota bacterium]